MTGPVDSPRKRDGAGNWLIVIVYLASATALALSIYYRFVA